MLRGMLKRTSSWSMFAVETIRKLDTSFKGPHIPNTLSTIEERNGVPTPRPAFCCLRSAMSILGLISAPERDSQSRNSFDLALNSSMAVGDFRLLGF